MLRKSLTIVLVALASLISCSKSDDATPNESEEINENTPEGCTNPSSFTFNEQNGVIAVEIEQGVISDDWSLQNNSSNFSGNGYYVWQGAQSFGNPGNGTIIYKIRVTTTGTYRFLWRSAVTIGSNGTEHNDTWLRFADASDFYGLKGESIIYPKGTGKTPNPNGSSADGWFKIYRSGNDLGFKWQAFTSDNDAHQIYVDFDRAGVYTMEVSARSSGHAIDKFVLFKEDTHSQNDATAAELSEISCN